MYYYVSTNEETFVEVVNSSILSRYLQVLFSSIQIFNRKGGYTKHAKHNCCNSAIMPLVAIFQKNVPECFVTLSKICRKLHNRWKIIEFFGNKPICVKNISFKPQTDLLWLFNMQRFPALYIICICQTHFYDWCKFNKKYWNYINLRSVLKKNSCYFFRQTIYSNISYSNLYDIMEDTQLLVCPYFSNFIVFYWLTIIPKPNYFL